MVAKSQPTDASDREPLSGLVERVTFHSSETGFCVLRVKVRGHGDLVTVLGDDYGRVAATLVGITKFYATACNSAPCSCK